MKGVVTTITLIFICIIDGFCQVGIDGLWLFGEGQTKIEIYPENTDTFSGKVVWLKDSLDSNGKPWKDIKNSV